ncbi:hypothetical protein [Rhizomicrobium electricum]|uniref:Beta-glucuronidase C-terminal domain-containing protein n=1 Tax=Rhizomicrobium electricum TaxID=480070 RepID=A0ABN1E4N8_9PROT|nr:hypothetical protein [Rhizomicrobium electricum]NIJ47640.1 hypothetical protein [Rhizomicrobium electricum]
MRILASLLASAAVFAAAEAAPAVNPGALPKLGTVDARFQSYNVEMIEVTGGAFWKPYGAPDVAPDGPTPAGMDPKIYAYRTPKDLYNPRLRMLAAALGPSYVRVSGTWANATYFADTDTPPAKPPAGFNGLLTRAQWKGVVDFAHAVDAKIVTSFALSTGTRDANGVWTPETAKPWLAYTKSIGGEIAAAEFANEPSLVALMSVPKGYDAAQWGRDFKLWRAFLKETSPGTLVLGPGAVGDKPGPGNPAEGRNDFMSAAAMETASGPGVDAFSYHHYGDVSERCHGKQTLDKALSEEWLARTSGARAVYASLRDHYGPGKPLWLTEVGDAACGGNPWAKTFADSFRYLDQLGRLAKDGVQTVMHNTLAISDYGMIDEKTLKPRPNYWAALLWRRLMGTTVLDSTVPLQQGLHVYAHCEAGVKGGVTLLVINNDAKPSSLQLASRAQRYTLSEAKIDDGGVRLNGRTLALTKDGKLPVLKGVPAKAGTVTFDPETITFLAVPEAKNKSCGI